MILFWVWLGTLVATAVYNEYWLPRSVWNNHLSEESQRLSLAVVSIVVPPVGFGFRWWDLRHQDRHPQSAFRR